MNEKTVIREAIKSDMPDFEQVRAACIAQGSIVTTKETRGVRHIPVFSAALAVVVMIMSFPFLSVQPTGLNELVSPQTKQSQTVNNKTGTTDAGADSSLKSTAADNTETAVPDIPVKSPDKTPSKAPSDTSDKTPQMPENTAGPDNEAIEYALTDDAPQAYTVNYIDPSEQNIVKEYLSCVDYSPVPGQITRYSASNLGELKQYLNQRNFRLMKSYVNQTDMTMLRVTDKQGLLYICYTNDGDEDYFFVGSGMSPDDFIDGVFEK